MIPDARLGIVLLARSPAGLTRGSITFVRNFAKMMDCRVKTRQ